MNLSFLYVVAKGFNVCQYVDEVLFDEASTNSLQFKVVVFTGVSRVFVEKTSIL